MTKQEFDFYLAAVGGDVEAFWANARPNVLDQRGMGAQEAAYALDSAFGWAGSPQGGDYWSLLHEKLCKYTGPQYELKSICNCYWSYHPYYCSCPRS